MRIENITKPETIKLLTEIYKDFNSNIGSYKWNQFRHCNCYTTEDSVIFETSGGVEYLSPIRSYSTVVGFVNRLTHEVFECGKYSQTTSKQFTQMYNALYNGYKRYYVDIDKAEVM